MRIGRGEGGVGRVVGVLSCGCGGTGALAEVACLQERAGICMWRRLGATVGGGLDRYGMTAGEAMRDARVILAGVRENRQQRPWPDEMNWIAGRGAEWLMHQARIRPVAAIR